MSEWDDDLATVLARCESRERELAYPGGCEEARRSTGSYYTPLDVARFFWLNYFEVFNISDAGSARCFLERYRFIEPSAGSGILFFALLKSVGEIGLANYALNEVLVELIDINPRATGFIREQLRWLRRRHGAETLRRVRVTEADFLKWGDRGPAHSAAMVFGNPPFVMQAGEWCNSSAQFLDHALDLASADGSVCFIMPLSLCFSRGYERQRMRIRQLNAETYIANFDNIPDTLFKAGKPLSPNSNKANSQRCSIVAINGGRANRLFATRLIRWRASDRCAVLSRSPEYFRLENRGGGDQFPRPASAKLLAYLKEAEGAPCLSTLCTADGPHHLFISGVARNFIGVREEYATGVLTLTFSSERDLYRTLGLVTSDLFFQFWLTFGDGFHVTRGMLMSFPLSDSLLRYVDASLGHVREMWRSRAKFAKEKLNSGRRIRTYDFSPSGLKFGNSETGIREDFLKRGRESRL